MLKKITELDLKIQKILPVFNTSDISSDIKRLERFLLKNTHVKIIEITLRQKNSLNIAIELKNKFTELNFGLGSILSKEDYKIGVDAGFKFFVSPGIIKDLINDNAQNYIPGGETISEFIYLLNNGYKVIKFFPSNLLGGEKKLLAIENILQEALFIPTGGINAENYLNYLSLKNVLCVGMSKFD